MGMQASHHPFVSSEVEKRISSARGTVPDFARNERGGGA